MDHSSPTPLAKVDLHCHSRASRWKHFAHLANSRDSYTDPVVLYREAKARGMDLVTISDHDTIDGCKELLDKLGPLPDFFVSEEVETWFPETRQRIHVNVFGITEVEHEEIQRLRWNIRELAAYIESAGILASVNHPFQNYRMANDARRYLGELARMFSVFEVRNGTMAAAHNRLVADVAELLRRAGAKVSLVGGSDAHNLKPLARVYTMAPATTPEELFAAIRAGHSFAWGDEVGLTDVLLAVHETVGKHVLSVLDLGDRDRTAREKLRHLVVTLACLPVHASGMTAAITSLNYVKQILVTRSVGRELLAAIEADLAEREHPSVVAHDDALTIRRGVPGIA